MVNGTLREYLRSRDRGISQQQRQSWIQGMAEGLELLHTLGILHCDLAPHNMFLDDKLELKIGDSGCSSVGDSVSTAGTSRRFYPPRTSWSSPVITSDDLFALMSCMYEVLTGVQPYQETSTLQVRTLMTLQQFPDLTGLDHGSIIQDSWLLRALSANSVHRRIDTEFK